MVFFIFNKIYIDIFLKFIRYNMLLCFWMNVIIYVNILYLWNNDVFLGL